MPVQAHGAQHVVQQPADLAGQGLARRGALQHDQPGRAQLGRRGGRVGLRVQRLGRAQQQAPGGTPAAAGAARAAGSGAGRRAGAGAAAGMGRGAAASARTAAGWAGAGSGAGRAGGAAQTVTPISCSMARWRASSSRLIAADS
ncbi:hypothetical protein ALDI51_43500 [Alicycliphilus denitrificans]|nr:hypothetical protein ALDI51_43500 [Alicycliphilus denitrificans]